MNDIIDLDSRRKHVTVKMVCGGCSHEFISVHPTNSAQQFECPSCHEMKAEPVKGGAYGEASFMQCNCGTDRGVYPVILHDAGAPLIVSLVCAGCEQEVAVNNGRLVLA